MKKQTQQGNTTTTAITIVLVIAVVIFAGMYIIRNNIFGLAISVNEDGTAITEDGVVATDEDAAEIIARVGQLFLIPEEEPVIATITDATALAQEQAFYANVQNGDTLLVFPEAAQAILYSGERDIIINVGPVIVDPEAEAPANPEESTEETPETSEESTETAEESTEEAPSEQ